MNQHEHEHMPDQHQLPSATDGGRHDDHADHAAADAATSKQSATAPTGDGHTGPRDDQSSHEGTGHSGIDHMGMSATIPLAYRPTHAQIAAVSFLSVLALTAAVIFSASYA